MAGVRFVTFLVFAAFFFALVIPRFRILRDQVMIRLD
jgi:hypothetical protein